MLNHGQTFAKAISTMGLGQGIWPGQQTQHSAASFTGSSLYDIGNAFGNMHLGRSQGQLANTDNDFQHANIGFAPQTSGTAWNTGNNWLNKPFSPAGTSFTQVSAMHTNAQQSRSVVRHIPVSAPRSRSPLKPAGIGFDTVVPSVAPEPSELYLRQAANAPCRMPTPQPLLIISDLNGTLISRKQRTAFKPRPGLSSFLAFVMDAAEVQTQDKPAQQKSKIANSALKKSSLNPSYSPNLPEASASTTTTAATKKDFRFMIWTSARPKTINRIVSDLLTPDQRSGVVAIWARNTLGLSAEQYHGKTQVYKRLETVWRDTETQRTHPNYSRGERWSQRNTVLIDDSIKKGCSEPFNLINIPELTEGRLGRELGLAQGKISNWRLQKNAQGGPAEANATTDSTDVLGDGPPGVLRLVAEYIEEARWYADVSSFMKSQPFKVDMAAGGASSATGKEDEKLNDDNEQSDDADDDMGMGNGVPLGQEVQDETKITGLQEPLNR